MIRIMIVDDMPLFLEYLRGCIDWESYGFEICCEAQDGKEALDKIEEFYPDVVLTDITMPHINGLELAERITRDYPDISVILITGNNEFEYARKAVKIGVCDYIVKPFEKEELILSLLKLQDNMGKALENATESHSEYNYNDLRALIYAGSDHGNITEGDIFPDPSSEHSFLLGLVKFDESILSKDLSFKEKLMNWESLIAKMLEDKLDIQGDFRIFHDFENNIVILMRFANSEEMNSYKGYEFIDIVQIVKNSLEIDSAVSLCATDSFRDIRHVYEKALSFLARKGMGQVYDLRNIKGEASYTSLDAIFSLNKNLEALKAEDAAEVINKMWDSVKDHAGDDGTSLSFSYMNLLSSIISILMTNIINSGFSVEKIYGDGFSPENYFKESGSPDEMKDKVIDLFKKRIEFEKVGSSSKTHDIALSAKKYIEDNYGNSELSISEISEKLCVNQTYLRKMFKSEMNMTLSEYITAFRMQEAKRYITSTDEKLSAISEKVGYSDVSYFSNVFKKYYGISPRSMNKE